MWFVVCSETWLIILFNPRQNRGIDWKLTLEQILHWNGFLLFRLTRFVFVLFDDDDTGDTCDTGVCPPFTVNFSADVEDDNPDKNGALLDIDEDDEVLGGDSTVGDDPTDKGGMDGVLWSIDDIEIGAM